MTNPENTRNFSNEVVDYKEWLSRPVFTELWWSPTGAHVEALVQVKNGEQVSDLVVESITKSGEGTKVNDRLLPYIHLWNERVEEGNEILAFDRNLKVTSLTEEIIDYNQEQGNSHQYFTNIRREIVEAAVEIRRLQQFERNFTEVVGA